MFHCYLDDFTEGSIFETEGKTVSEAEILEFAFKYDPQSFHMDVEAAKEGPFGGLIASGIQTMAIGLRLLLQAQVFAPGASMGSPGMDELRWLKPGRQTIQNPDIKEIAKRRRNEHQTVKKQQKQEDKVDM